MVLTEALHSIKSLLSSATNITPYKKFFGIRKRSSVRPSLPSWLKCPGTEALKPKPNYAHVRHLNVRLVSVSLEDVAPYLSEANHLNEKDLPERSSDDTENEVCGQVSTEKNCNNTEEKDVPYISTRTNKGISSFRYDIHESSVYNVGYVCFVSVGYYAT